MNSTHLEASIEGGYVNVAHNLIQRDAMKQVVISGVRVKGGSPFNTCNQSFGDCLNLGAATRADEDIETNLQKPIPDGLIGCFDLVAPVDSPPNCRFGSSISQVLTAPVAFLRRYAPQLKHGR